MEAAERLVDVSAADGGRDPAELALVEEWDGIDEVRSNRVAVVLVFDSEHDRDALIIDLPGLDVQSNGDARWQPNALAFDCGDSRDPSYRRRAEAVVERKVPPEVEEWERAGLPAFEPLGARISLAIDCETESDRDELVGRLGLKIAKKTRGTLSAWWPPRDREDLSSLRFESSGFAPLVAAEPLVERVEVGTQLTLL